MTEDTQVGTLEERIETVLVEVNQEAGYHLSCVCDESGLLLATAGALPKAEVVAGLTSLFDEIVVRAVRDLEFTEVDEVTLLDRVHGRFIIRPLPFAGPSRLFLVVLAPPRARWRRNTNTLLRYLDRTLTPFFHPGDDHAP